MLSVEKLSVKYGNNLAVDNVSINVNQGEVVCILGANGAGKSSLLRALIGHTKSSGNVLFNSKEFGKLSTTLRVGNGLVLVPEGRRILTSLTVEENLLMGAHLRKDNLINQDIQNIYNMFPNLSQRRAMFASVLSGGEQQMLAVGRALLAKPNLLMLDEPSLGLSPLFVDELFEVIKDLNSKGMSILLVEQNARKALQISSRAYVMELGKVVKEGNSKEISEDQTIISAYLGG
ncbi:ABC transporter ATP-binding protein [Alphaproteobacteria bacterium]|nr:ABC transporter ATP-binding protein [Alphaproteobacteria bacterium]